MAIPRKRWNNIIIVSALLMIGTLSFLDDRTSDLPSDTQALFDSNAQLAQLQLDGVWLAIQPQGSQCDHSVLNCNTWVSAWKTIQVSPINEPTEEALADPQELVIQIEGIAEAQVWLLFPSEGILKSPSQNWYQVPPSLRGKLQPVLDASHH